MRDVLSKITVWVKTHTSLILKFVSVVFDEAALTDDLLVQLVGCLKKHKESINKKKESEATKEKKKEPSEGSNGILSLKLYMDGKAVLQEK